MKPVPSDAERDLPGPSMGEERRSNGYSPTDPVSSFRRLSDAHELFRSLQRERSAEARLMERDGDPEAVRERLRRRSSLFDVVRANGDLVRRIQEAVRTTLKIHSRSAIEVMPVLSDGLPGQSDVAIIGILRLTGSPHENSLLALGLSGAAFAEIYENMFGEPLDELSEDNQDLAGELVNIIFQTIDPDLRILGLELEPSLPAFLTGRAIEGWSLAADGHSFVLPFSTDAGDLFIAIPESLVDAHEATVPEPSSRAERKKAEVERAVLAGATWYIVKPFDPETIRGALEKVLASAGAVVSA